jgi:hypothetical protein
MSRALVTAIYSIACDGCGAIVQGDVSLPDGWSSHQIDGRLIDVCATCVELPIGKLIAAIDKRLDRPDELAAIAEVSP